ncbi:MAG: MmgE/PrpD family protein [Acuticoccus sp.]
MGETRQLAEYLVRAERRDIPDAVWKEAHRALVNYVGCALGGAPHPSMDITLKALGPYAGPAISAVIGRRERTDPLNASLLNGLSSHIHDYDDTTPKNYNHPTSPLASALFAYASVNKVSGADFVHAFVLGFEAEQRIGNAVYPSHYDIGWHITGTVGVFAAAAAVGRLMGLDEQRMIWALGLAATQAAGLREMFGSMGKAFHPGRSAQNGYTAALLAREGFTAGERALEGPRGFAAILSQDHDLAKITDGLGTRYELPDNTYKPFPCGIVVHPTIDACITLRQENDFSPDQVASVALRVAPLVKDLCNQQDIRTGLQGKFSIYHAAAVGLVRARAGLGEFTDAAANDPAIKAMRARISADGDPAVTEDGVIVRVTLADGTVLEKTLEHSLGNIERPLSDAQLETKFRDQASVIAPEQLDRLVDACWHLGDADDVGRVVDLAVPA